jgi:hypothetical protein
MLCRESPAPRVSGFIATFVFVQNEGDNNG